MTGQAEIAEDPKASLTRLGVDVLMAAQLQAWIASTFDVEIPLVRILHGPTVEQLAKDVVSAMADLESTDEEPTPALITSFEAGAEPLARLICLPPMTGDASTFELLAQKVDPHLEVSVLTLPELGGPHEGLLFQPEAILRDQILSAALPLTDPPFVMYGHSMGGWLALSAELWLWARGRVAPLATVVAALPSRDVIADAAPSGVTEPGDVDEEAIRRAAVAFGMPRELLEYDSLGRTFASTSATQPKDVDRAPQHGARHGRADHEVRPGGSGGASGSTSTVP